MPTPSGQISLSDVNVELSKASTAQVSLNDSDVRVLAQIVGSGTTISMNDLRGKSAGFGLSISSSSSSLSIAQTATITFTLTTASYDFDNADITVSGGSLSTLATSNYVVYTATFTPTNNSSGTASISVAQNTFTSQYGTLNSASNTINISYDTQRPSITISTSSNSLSISQTASLTFTLSESSSNFTSADVTVSGGGSISNFTGSGVNYSATYTPPTSATGTASIDVAGGTFSDSFGNTNNAATTVNISYNTVPAPTYSISPNVTSVNEGNSVQYTVTTTNVPNGTTLYWTQIINIGNASASDMSDLQDSGSVTINSNTGSFTRTLSADLSTEGTETLSVQLRTGSTSGTIVATATNVSVIDTSTSPTITITPSTISNGTVDTSYSAQFFVQVNGTNTPAYLSTSGTLPPGLTFAGFGSTGGGYFTGYSLSGTPTTGGTYTFSVSGYTNSGFASSRSYTVSIFGAPTVTLSRNNSGTLTAGQTTTITFTTNTPAYGFTQSDIYQFGSGTLSNFTGSDGNTTFSVLFTPPSESSGSTDIRIPLQSFQNNIGGWNATSSTLTIDYDTRTSVVTNPLPFNGQTYTDLAEFGEGAESGVLFLRDGTYIIYRKNYGNLGPYNWISGANANSGVGKYVRFTRTSQSISITGSATSNTGWIEITNTIAGPYTAYAIVSDYNIDYNLRTTTVTYNVQISTTADGSNIVASGSITLRAQARDDNASGGGFIP